MLANYRAIFRPPGTAAFCAAGFVMRLPIAIYPIGLVLIVSSRSGHYGFAGLLSGCYSIGAVPGGPLLSRAVDRLGQRRVIIPATAVHIAAILALAGLFAAHTADWTLIAPAFLGGFSYLTVGSLIRARWSRVFRDDPQRLSTAFSLESALDEVIFVVGPLVATVLATHGDPIAVLIVGVVLVGAGAAWLAAQRATEPPVHPRAEQQPAAIRLPGMLLFALAATAMGAVFASAEIALVAFCSQHHERGLSGAVLAAMAGGSAISGFLYGSRHWAASVQRRLRWQTTIFAALPFTFLATLSLPLAAVCAFLVGWGIAPTLITLFGTVNEITPAALRTESLTWALTGLNLGYGAGSALVGPIADAHGARVAFSVTIAAGLCALIVVLIGVARDRGASGLVVPSPGPGS